MWDVTPCRVFPDVRNVPPSSSRVQGSWPPQGSGTTSHPRRPAIPDKTVAETSNFAGIILNHPSRLSLSLSQGQLCDYCLPAEVLNIICKCGNNVGGTRGDET